ncbi:uncharacterized protein LOC129793278 [Lutzomyia longipalpis]|uniref:uncharacterized protein LOC129793278 n=1 Tax=Lutzomyia longipalpis TaxID=7200 RepID=UPI002483E13D|nr:uncharacterized protein LOC129793278 [Lutzomyia longipalpis]
MTTPPTQRPRLTAVEMEALIPAFEPGQKNGLLAEEWIRKVDDAIVLFDMDAKQSLVAAVFRLKGAAKDWYEGNQGNIRSYSDFKKEILLNFPEKLSVAQVHHELKSRKKKEDESIEEYFHAVVKQARRIRLEDDAIRDYLIEGIPDTMMQGLLTAAPPSSLTEFLCFMKKVHTIIKDKSGNNSEEKKRYHPYKRWGGKKGANDAGTSASEAEEKDSMEEKEEEKKINPGKPRKRQCFACGSEEHLVKQCPKRKDFP